MATKLLRSDVLVKVHDRLTRDAAANRSNVLYQAVARLPEGANPGIDSYLRQLGRRMGQLTLPYETIRDCSAEEAAQKMRAAHGKRGATIVMTPDKEIDAMLETLAEDPARDGDAMTGAGLALRWPATPRSIRELAEFEVGPLKNFDPERIAVVGAKGDVNIGLLAWLAQDGIVPGRLIDRDNSDTEVPKLHRNADLVISATGVAGLLTAQSLLRQQSDGSNALPMVVIDAGVGCNKNTGMTHGDVDPHLYTYTGKQELVISPAPVIFPDGHGAGHGGGVGRLTVEQFIAGGVRQVAGPLDVRTAVV